MDRTYHVSNDNGKMKHEIHWHLIDDPDDKDQARLIEGGKSLFGRLFDPEYLENYDNFIKYAIESAEARRNLTSKSLIDSWYLGSENGEVVAFLFFTFYPEHGFGVVPYMGSEREHFTRTIKRLISDERKELLPEVPIEAMLFELEKIPPACARDFLDMKRKKEDMTFEEDSEFQNVRRRLLITYAYQRLNARKIPWIKYVQPPLRIEDFSRPLESMHLMYWPTDSMGINRRLRFSKDHVTRIVDFMYRTFYFDGFMTTEPKKKWDLWERKLTELSVEATKDLPDHVDLEEVPFKCYTGKVFLSYTKREYPMALMLQRRFVDCCIDTFFWDENRSDNIGLVRDDVIESEFKNADAVVYLLTEKSIPAEGQLKEIQFLKKYPKENVYFLTNLDSNQLKIFGVDSGGSSGTIFGNYTNSSEFAQAGSAVLASLFKTKKAKNLLKP